MKLWMIKHKGALYPVDEHVENEVAKIPEHEPRLFESKKVRSPQLHRYYFAFLGNCYHHLPEHIEQQYPNFHAFRKAMQMYAGHYDIFISLKGEEMLIPKSIAYESLDEDQFRELITNIKHILRTHIFDPETLEKLE